jgi:hypothetical protein
MTQLDDLLGRLVGLLDDLAIPYHVGGSFASSFHGVPRTTADLDIVIELDGGRLEALAAALERDFYVSREAMREALHEGRSFNAILLDGSFKIDFFIRGARAFDLEEFRRARPEQIREDGSLTIRIKSPEDLILRKLEWFRAGGERSERQWEDVLNIFRATREQLDVAHLEHWAPKLGIADLLARARSEASLA